MRMMKQRLRFIIGKTSLLWAGIGFYLLFSIYLASQLQIPEVPAESPGPILFWQKNALYTINPDGTNLTKISPALLADQRFTEVSAGCHGLAQAPCQVIIGHVIYQISGRGIILPAFPNSEWLNAPVSWSPDGVSLAYFVSERESGQRSLLIYNTALNLLWRAAPNVDEAVKPAWSSGCRETGSTQCMLAYGQKASAGQKGTPIAVLNLNSGQTDETTIAAGYGNVLRWSDDNHLYYGGRLGWFSALDGSQVGDTGALQRGTPLFVSPTIDYVIFSDDPATRFPTQAEVGREIWLNSVSAHTSRLIYAFPPQTETNSHRAFEVLWSPHQNSVAVFNKDHLIYYDLAEENPTILTDIGPFDRIMGYAFSPDGDSVAIVGGFFPDTSEKPYHILFVTGTSGQPVTLIPRTKDPILVLAWLPGDYQSGLKPNQTGLMAWRFDP